MISISAREPGFAAIAAALSLIASGLLFSACASNPTEGYSFGSSYRDDIRTVHVPIFQNLTFSRGYEFELTDAIVKQIQSTTPWRASGSDTANTTLAGTITDVQLRPLSSGRDTGLVQEVAVRMTVEFEWRDNRSGKVLVARRNFSASDVFMPAQGLNERIEAGQYGAVQRLARDIVSELRSNW